MEFVDAPSEDFFLNCTRDQLEKMAKYCYIDVAGKKKKNDVRAVVLSALFKSGVLEEGEPPVLLDNGRTSVRACICDCVWLNVLAVCQCGQIE